MKKSIISGSAATILGLLIALGPKFIFRACSTDCSCCGDYPQCLWSVQAVFGMGLLIATLGLISLVYTDPKIHIGLTIGMLLAGIVSLLIIYVIIGGCEVQTMACHRRAFPVLTVICSLLLAGGAFNIYRLQKKA
jgi:hypothetical protein